MPRGSRRIGRRAAKPSTPGVVLRRHARAAPDPSPGAGRPAAARLAPELAELLYELLDAHADTSQLALTYEYDERWAVHLDYLRGLQRVGRQVLAELDAEEPSASQRCEQPLTILRLSQPGTPPNPSLTEPEQYP
jgi:hypothetical protein